MRKTGSALAIALGLAFAGHAQAHAQLEHAFPRVGAVISASPREVRLWFSEIVEPMFCSIMLEDATGRMVPTGHLFVNAKDKRQIAVPLSAALKPGAYRVRWHVVSVDTHRREGDFVFVIKP